MNKGLNISKKKINNPTIKYKQKIQTDTSQKTTANKEMKDNIFLIIKENEPQFYKEQKAKRLVKVFSNRNSDLMLLGIKFGNLIKLTLGGNPTPSTYTQQKSMTCTLKDTYKHIHKSITQNS